ncbi:MAG: PKD domain-containing protein [Solirubrobacteraceae bacterium]
MNPAVVSTPSRAKPARRLGGLVGLLAAGLAVFAVSPAAAADQQVQAQDDVFVTSVIAVKPGESVTWNHQRTNDPHNLTFDDAAPGFPSPSSPQFAPWTATRTFPTEGTYRFYCQEHGGPGGQGMSGIVYVNATGTVPPTPPAASFTVSPSSARVGEAVSFDARASGDPDGAIARYEWDLDGDGSYETDTGATPTTSRSYTTAGPRTVKLRVTDNQSPQGLTNETTRTLQVDAPPAPTPTPAPTAVPPPPPNPTPEPTPVSDITPPGAMLSGSRSQKLGTKVFVDVACLDESCRATSSATVRVPKVRRARAKTYTLKKVGTKIPKGASGRLKLKLTAAARGAIRRALKAHKKIAVKLKVSVADDAGNARTLKRQVKLKR